MYGANTQRMILLKKVFQIVSIAITTDFILKYESSDVAVKAFENSLTPLGLKRKGISRV
jgi:hypothetical protein